MRVMVITASLILIVIAAPSWSAEMYRWKNKQGEVVFGDQPPVGAQAEPITVEEIPKTGNRFSDESQIKRLHQDAAMRRELDARLSRQPAPRTDYHCRDYVSQLNKAEIQIQRSYNVRDAQKVVDLRKLIKKECGESTFNTKYDDWRCKQYRRDLEKARIYVEHTPNSVDQKKIDSLQQQIARECR